MLRPSQDAVKKALDQLHLHRIQQSERRDNGPKRNTALRRFNDVLATMAPVQCVLAFFPRVINEEVRLLGGQVVMTS